MAVQVLLEPLMGTPPWSPHLFAGHEPFGQQPVLGFDEGESLWGIRVNPWGAGWPMPRLQLFQLRSGVLAGRLTLDSLRQWIGALDRQGLSEVAILASTTLEAQLTSCQPVVWQRWRLDFDRPLIMGVVNVTPDSFSDGGSHLGMEAAVAHGLDMAAAGADILDVGGESTRPGAEPVSLEEELQRVVPVVAQLAGKVGSPISVDTTKPEVAEAALAAGGALVNDVAALMVPGMAEVVAERGCPVILMHRRGDSRTMQEEPYYDQIVAEVYEFLTRRVHFARGAGIRQVMVDVGIGFGKDGDHNMALLRHLRIFRGLGVPVLLGVSRKRVVGMLTGEESPAKRDAGSNMLAGLGIRCGAEIVRVHDVPGAVQAARVAVSY